MNNSDVRILVVDDENSLREMLTVLLQRQGYRVDCAQDGLVALERISEHSYDLIISDIKMPKMNGIDLLRRLREQNDEITVIMITAFSSTEEAVEAMKLGAYDYITKPFRNDEIRLVVRKALEQRELKRENLQLKQRLAERYSFKSLIGQSPAMIRLTSLLERVAPSSANVLISGESGTGKELVAQALHSGSTRKEHPFVAINCGAIPENLLESELFGHERGAFTGADKKKQGLFETAHRGTLFLDEMGELPMGMQVKLLRVLQEREFRRVGGTSNIPLDIRLIAATNQDLSSNVQQGTFREDLYYRINVVTIDLPPLRERRSDIPLLIQSFYQKKTGGTNYTIDKKVMELLLNYNWPGNVRELENLVERCLVLGGVETMAVEQLPPQFFQKAECPTTGLTAIPAGFNLEQWMEEQERQILLLALEQAGGVRTKASELLGISFRSIRYRLEKLGMNDSE